MFNVVPFGRTKGSERIFEKQNGMSLIKRLNRNGLEIQLWRTLLRMERPVFDFGQFLWSSNIRSLLN